MGQAMTEVRSPPRPLRPDTVGADHQPPPSLPGRAHKAQTDKPHRVRDLSGGLDAALFLDGWGDLTTPAASGVEGLTAQAYAVTFQANLTAWAPRLQGRRYRATRVRRWYLPQENGAARPVGIPAREDTLVPWAGAKLWTAISAQDLLDGRDGYRPGRGAWEAVRDLPFALQYGT